MEDFNINATSLDMSHDYNSTFNNSDIEKIVFIINVLTYIVICVGLPLTLVAIYALYSLVGKDHVAPIYVINLLISDFIQLCCMISFEAKSQLWIASNVMYFSSLFASVNFMVCIALERYLVIAWPLWYRFRRTIKISVVVCVLVWVFSFIFFFFTVFWRFQVIFFLLPLPLLIFFLVGTLKALSASVSVPADEKQRIVAMLVLVLVIYLLLFLPIIIMHLKDSDMVLVFVTEISIFTHLQYHCRDDMALYILSSVFLKLSPLADLVLYIFMRKGAVDKVLASVCCCRMDRNDVSSSTV